MSHISKEHVNSHLGKEVILGYSITYEDEKVCVQNILRGIAHGQLGRYFVCANPHSLHVAENDESFKCSLKNADLITPDGAGVLIASQLLGGRIKSRVTGTDIFYGVCAEMNRRADNRVFFLGSTEDILRDIRLRIGKDFPNITVVGTYSPPYVTRFSQDENDRIIEAINKVNPDVVWVGLTAPKQEKWIYENKDRLNVKFLGAIGAVFDFYAGRIKRPHPFLQSIGLEWLARLLREPKRLWRRTLISTPAFMFLILKNLSKRKRK